MGHTYLALVVRHRPLRLDSLAGEMAAALPQLLQMWRGGAARLPPARHVARLAVGEGALAPPVGRRLRDLVGLGEGAAAARGGAHRGAAPATLAVLGGRDHEGVELVLVEGLGDQHGLQDVELTAGAERTVGELCGSEEERSDDTPRMGRLFQNGQGEWTKLATSVCGLRRDRMEQGPTGPRAGRSKFLLSSGGAGGGYY